MHRTSKIILDGSGRRVSYMALLDRTARQTSSLYLKPWPDQLAYSKIYISICTFWQLPSPTKAMFVQIDASTETELNNNCVCVSVLRKYRICGKYFVSHVFLLQNI